MTGAVASFSECGQAVSRGGAAPRLLLRFREPLYACLFLRVIVIDLKKDRAIKVF